MTFVKALAVSIILSAMLIIGFGLGNISSVIELGGLFFVALPIPNAPLIIISALNRYMDGLFLSH